MGAVKFAWFQSCKCKLSCLFWHSACLVGLCGVTELQPSRTKCMSQHSNCPPTHFGGARTLWRSNIHSCGGFFCYSFTLSHYFLRTAGIYSVRRTSIHHVNTGRRLNCPLVTVSIIYVCSQPCNLLLRCLSAAADPTRNQGPSGTSAHAPIATKLNTTDAAYG